MLVLTRKVGEQVQIGDQICVTVVRIAEGVVRIGVEAPDNAIVVRSELLRAMDDDAKPLPRIAGDGS